MLPYRHRRTIKAEIFFLDGITNAMRRRAEQSRPASPWHTLASSSRGLTASRSTGWETFLEAVIRSGFALTGTWPMRTEFGESNARSGTNALASSIILVCRPRPVEAPTATRGQFVPHKAGTFLTRRNLHIEDTCFGRPCSGRYRAGHGRLHALLEALDASGEAM